MSHARVTLRAADAFHDVPSRELQLIGNDKRHRNTAKLFRLDRIHVSQPCFVVLEAQEEHDE